MILVKCSMNANVGRADLHVIRCVFSQNYGSVKVLQSRLGAATHTEMNLILFFPLNNPPFIKASTIPGIIL